MRPINIELKPILKELENMTGEELKHLGDEENKQFRIAEEKHKSANQIYYKRKAVIYRLLKQKCVDDTGTHEWTRDSYAYAPIYCKKCLCEK